MLSKNQNNQQAALLLEDGMTFIGEHFGYNNNTHHIGEIVFNTSMSGYQEIITDPSYKAQMVCFTYPSIGNYGINIHDNESNKPYLAGIIVREYCQHPSNHQSIQNLDTYLIENKIPGICNIDTRALVLYIREKGSLQAGIFTVDSDKEFQKNKKEYLSIIQTSPKINEINLTTEFNGHYGNDFCQKYIKLKKEKNPHLNIETWPKVLVLDFGIKLSILQCLLQEHIYPIVVPGNAPYNQWQNIHLRNFKGFCISNGPGDPSVIQQGITNVKHLLETKKPILGICLGHQLLCLALSLKTYKMKFGHHGANQPLLSSAKKEIWITSQNHSFAVSSLTALENSTNHCILERNLNDESIEGFLSNSKHLMYSVQYHPEASPGPQDARELFANFSQKLA